MTFNPRTYLHTRRAALHQRYVRGPASQFIFEFISFGIKQAWACIFGGLMLAMLIGTYLFYPEDAAIARYDFITLAAIAIQAVLLMTRLETLEEFKVILIFHIVGTVMEIFKTHVGSWIYPEPSVLRIMGVPLFSGFMYACVGSYMARVWRIFDFRFTRFPPLWAQGLLALAAYVNFFAHHFTVDIRNVLFAASVIIYARCWIYYKPDEVHRKMPMLLGLCLVAVFIWFAENLGTYANAWRYPGQTEGWHMVSVSKLGAWYLLMLISFVLVAWVHMRGHKKSGEALAPPL